MLINKLGDFIPPIVYFDMFIVLQLTFNTSASQFESIYISINTAVTRQLVPSKIPNRKQESKKNLPNEIMDIRSIIHYKASHNLRVMGRGNPIM